VDGKLGQIRSKKKCLALTNKPVKLFRFLQLSLIVYWTHFCKIFKITFGRFLEQFGFSPPMIAGFNYQSLPIGIYADASKGNI